MTSLPACRPSCTERWAHASIWRRCSALTRLWPVKVDPNELESAIVNLAVNARDAMPEGGRLTIETGDAELDAAYCADNPDARPGDYVAICV